MTDQPKALWLAEYLKRFLSLPFDQAAAAELRRLHKRVSDYEADAKAVMAEQCAGDKAHCSCVPHLRTGIKELQAKNEALRAALEAALDFAVTVGPGASWWDDIWPEHQAALDAARDKP